MSATVYVRDHGGFTPMGIGSKVGPLGVSPKKAGEEFVRSTTDFKNIKVTCKLTIQNRVITKVEVEPSASALLQKELQRDPIIARGTPPIRNLTLKQIYSVARAMRRADKSLAKEFSGTVKEILGTARSLRYTVEGKTPAEITAMINSKEIVVPAE